MGGFDSYCFICGSNAQVSASLHSPFQSHEFPEEKTKHFLLNDEDDAFAEDLVSVGPYDEQNRPIINAMEIYRGALPAEPREAARLAAIDPMTIRLVDGLGPGGFHDLGGLGCANGDDTGDFTINAAVYPFGHSLCFRLLSAFVPSLMDPVGKFWAVVRAQNETEYTRDINGVDYGDIAGSKEQFVYPLHNYECGSDDELPIKLTEVLCKDTVEPEDVHDYWLGTGKIYVFKRPDVFPVAEAYRDNQPLYTRDAGAAAVSQPGPLFTDLPVELLLAIASPLLMQDALKLLLLSYPLRAKFLRHIDALAKQQLEPWAFAAEFEKARWDALCTNTRTDSTFPWHAYARACQRSPSMQNRRRIYGICLQLEMIAKKHEIL